MRHQTKIQNNHSHQHHEHNNVNHKKPIHNTSNSNAKKPLTDTNNYKDNKLTDNKSQNNNSVSFAGFNEKTKLLINQSFDNPNEDNNVSVSYNTILMNYDHFLNLYTNLIFSKILKRNEITQFNCY